MQTLTELAIENTKRVVFTRQEAAFWAKSEVIGALDVRKAREDVQRFLRPNELPSLELWTRDFFLQQCRKLARE